MTKQRILTLALPTLISILCSGFTWHGFLVAQFGGMFIWVFYYLVWYFTDGFTSSSFSENIQYEQHIEHVLNPAAQGFYYYPADWYECQIMGVKPY